MKGDPITNISSIIQLAQCKKSCFHSGWNCKVPAAFLQNFQARMLYNMIVNGYLFEYIPKSKIIK